MKWEKLGRIFQSSGQYDWMKTHASVPTPEPVSGDVIRIYFTPRDVQSRSHIAYLVINLNEPQKILDLSAAPALSPGSLGAFDDSGAMFSWLLHHEGRRWLYYIGWTLGVSVPWRTAIGLAYAGLETDRPIFARHSLGPIIDRSTADPYFVTNPCVMIENDLWRMWYLSGTRWDHDGKKALPRYNVRHAESRDGINWEKRGHICIEHTHKGEVAIGRPCVLKEGGIYKMWYSYRGDDFGYRMGYAESPDGLNWTRLDETAELAHSDSGWDSTMTAYPTVFDHNGRRYMLYCGNEYSKGGFGLAIATS
ncbi:MAG TPA: hypothetical protein VEI95_09775 [Acidobacteriota bacterium]|nr:hypothetical protein [Acidobacteriota bacterium]